MLTVSLACDRGVVARLLPLQPRDLSQPATLLRSYADGLLRKQMDPFLFQRSAGKSAACLPSTCPRANLASYPRETTNDHQEKSFPRRQPVESCRSAAPSRNIP